MLVIQMLLTNFLIPIINNNRKAEHSQFNSKTSILLVLEIPINNFLMKAYLLVKQKQGDIGEIEVQARDLEMNPVILIVSIHQEITDRVRCLIKDLMKREELLQ